LSLSISIMVKKFVLVSIGVVIIFVVGFWVVSSWKNRGAVSVGGFLIKTNKIALISEVPGVSFVWKDEIGFNSYLDTLDFWGSKTVKDFSSPAILKADAKRMIIKLVKEVKDPFYVSSDIEGKVWDAIGESVGADGTVKIDIYRRDWDERSVNMGIAQTVFKISKGGGPIPGKNLFYDFDPKSINLDGYFRIKKR